MSHRSEFAPAKINLYLHVVGRRDDGYHLLDSLVIFAQVGDRVTVEPAEKLSLSITGPFAAELPDKADNLVLRAAQELGDRVGIRPTGHITLEKNLPVASGIGGGSADAAATLKLMMHHWQILPDPDDIRAVALRLGADLPVCLAGRTAHMSGVGEVLKLVPPIPAIGLVLLNPRIPLATAAVFKARAGAFSAPAPVPQQPWPDARALVADLQHTRNDLEAPARQLVPAIDDVLASITAMPGCLLARMSGAGATCFGIFESPQAAAAAAACITREGWWVWGGGVRDQGSIRSQSAF